ncbi:iron(III) transport system ATP-binding protein [Mycetocola sp. CAN_C7]|uniref:ABC transporter ATP-binding protein n=1 Tax=Mycetocola sp. CAN_C7 TaxID=2787724 RepID=UPI0018CA7EF8
MTSLTLSGVSKSLGNQPILHNINFSLQPGTRLALVGASGSGKSTLLRLIAGFATIDAGSISLGNTLLSSPSEHLPAHRRGIGYVAQDGALFPHLTARQNIRFGLPRSAARDGRVTEVAELAALNPDLLDRYPHELSGGQQQRVSLARALAPQPRLILLDEPFSALDTGLRTRTRQAVIDTLQLAGTTTILVTHDHEEALTFGDSVGVIVAGHLEQLGTPSLVFDAPDTRELATFLGNALLLDAQAGAHPASVLTALGVVPVWHDRTAGATGGRTLMLRPSQLTVNVHQDAPNAEIVSFLPAGQYARVTLRLSDGTRIVVPVPATTAAGLAPRDQVTVSVLGGGVAYPSI